MLFPFQYENSGVCPLYKFLMASEEGIYVPAVMESARTMGQAVLHLAFYYCLATSPTNLPQLEASSVIPHL